ncbi:MAG TPA: TetR/AcrR family transcriptional regulator [Bacillota bacterium]|nr:TetR/AcrR family transcriptional regulator [Bacillota bacterium]
MNVHLARGVISLKEGIREKIFKAAQRLFVEKGYHSTSVPEIVKEAQVSTGAVYHHFNSKEELARAIHQQAVQEFIERYDQEVRSQNKTRDKIRGYVTMMFRWVEQDPIMVEYLLYARPKEVLEKCMTICSEEGLSAVKEIIVEGMESGELKSTQVVVAAATLSGILIRLIEMRLDKLIDLPLTELIDPTVENIWFALRS